MRKVYHEQGGDAPFSVFRPARDGGEEAEYPGFDPRKVKGQGNDGNVETDDEYPELQAVFWLLAPKGKGRNALSVDQKGNVKPNLDRRRFGLGTPGVKESPLNPGELDVAEFLRDQIALGNVRVDHLEDADGNPLGIPDDDVWAGRDSARDWCWGVLDPARLKQLDEELSASEDGRQLWRVQP